MLACIASREAFSSTLGGRLTAPSSLMDTQTIFAGGCGRYLVARDGLHRHTSPPWTKVRRLRRSPTASLPRSTVFAFRFTRLVISWARHRSGSNVEVRSGSSPAITRPTLTSHVSRSNRSVAMSSSVSAHLGYQSIVGRRQVMYSLKFSDGGKPISMKVGRVC